MYKIVHLTSIISLPNNVSILYVLENSSFLYCMVLPHLVPTSLGGFSTTSMLLRTRCPSIRGCWFILLLYTPIILALHNSFLIASLSLTFGSKSKASVCVLLLYDSSYLLSPILVSPTSTSIRASMPYIPLRVCDLWKSS